MAGTVKVGDPNKVKTGVAIAALRKSGGHRGKFMVEYQKAYFRIYGAQPTGCNDKDLGAWYDKFQDLQAFKKPEQEVSNG